MSVRRAGVAMLVALAACAHAPAGRGRVTARLLSLEVQPASRGELRLLARYQLDGLPLAAWKPGAAQLTVSLNDVPFAVAVAQPKLLPGDALELPLGLTFVRPPQGVTASWLRGEPIRVRLRGRLQLDAPDNSERVPTDQERALVLPPEVLPVPRG